MTLICYILAGVAAVNIAATLLREGKTWTIRQGKHSPFLNLVPLILRLRKTGDVTSVNFSVNASMFQSPVQPEDKLDWNKITGEGVVNRTNVSFLWNQNQPWHHHTSWRIAWDYNDLNNKVTLGIYYYQNAERKEFILQSYTPQSSSREFSLQIMRMSDRTVFSLKDLFTGEYTQFVLMGETFSGITYRLRPYFGGNNTTQHDTTVRYQFD